MDYKRDIQGPSNERKKIKRGMYVMAKLMQKNHRNHKSHNFFKNNILSDSLLTKYTLQIRLKSLQWALKTPW